MCRVGGGIKEKYMATKKTTNTTNRVIAKISDILPGYFVFVERYPDDKGADGKPISTYGTGEYIVVETGAFTFQACEASGGAYAMQNLKTFSLAGPDRWAVTKMVRKEELLSGIVSGVLNECELCMSGKAKPQWVMSVYEKARATIMRISLSLPSTSVVERIKIVHDMPPELKVGKWVIRDGKPEKLPSGARIVYEI